ncbi:hypothetical protein TWF730_003963 [Orbilia blumenaviensis]|uniref:NACHT domain-containing protein n=1 Tax=Orbilia blumenaviensis TaxID=1796055 RepID=A0AAV9U190_9PEZI
MSSRVGISGGAPNYGGTQFNGNPSFQSESISFGSTGPDSEYQCLRDLYSSGYDPSAEKARLEAAENKLISDSYAWIFQDDNFLSWVQDDSSRVLRLVGGPGKGKTMSMIGLTNHLNQNINTQPKPSAISYFFCRAIDERLSDATLLLKGLLHHLLSQQPNQILVRYLKDKYDKGGSKIFEGAQCNFILGEILVEILRDDNFSRFYLIIDALDECTTGIHQLLGLIKLTTERSPKVKWLVSSRNNIDIDGFFRVFGSHLTISLECHKPEVNTGIEAYIQAKVSELSFRNRYNIDQRYRISQELNKRAGGTYLWVHIACKNLEKCLPSKALDALKGIPSGLNAIYSRMVQILQIENENDNPELFSLVLATVTVALRPLARDELITLINDSNNVEELEEVLDKLIRCGAFLSLQDDHIYFIHQSAKEFLEQQAGLQASAIPESLPTYHDRIWRNCLRLFREDLHQDICNLKHPGFFIKDLSSDQRSLISHLEYACCCWGTHFMASGQAGADEANTLLEEFLENDLLYWIEVLSLLRRVPDGINQIACLHRLCSGFTLRDKFKDAEAFMMAHRSCLMKAPLQVYSGALVFSPDGSWVKDTYKYLIPNWVNVLPMIDNDWQGIPNKFDVPFQVYLLVISQDSQLLALLNRGKGILVFDIKAGIRLTAIDWDDRSYWDDQLLTPAVEFTKKMFENTQDEGMQFSEDKSGLLLSFWEDSKPAMAILQISTGTCIHRPLERSLNERLTHLNAKYGKTYILPDARRCIWYTDSIILLGEISQSGEFLTLRILVRDTGALGLKSSSNGLIFAAFISSRAWSGIQIYETQTGSLLCEPLKNDYVTITNESDDLVARVYQFRNTIALSRTGKSIAVAFGNQVYLLTPDTGGCRKLFEMPQGPEYVYFSRSGSKLVCIFESPSLESLSRVSVYNIENCSMEMETWVTHISSLDEQLFSFVEPYTQRRALWDPDFPERALDLNLSALDPVKLIARNPSADGTTLVIHMNGFPLTLQIRNINHLWKTKPPIQDRNIIPFPVVDSKGVQLSKGRIIKKGCKLDESVERFGGHESTVSQVIFSPDGTQVASICDKSLSIWNPQTLEEQGSILLQDNSGFPPPCISFSNCGSRLVYALFTSLDCMKLSILDIKDSLTCRDSITVDYEVYCASIAYSPNNALVVFTTYTSFGFTLRIGHWSTATELVQMRDMTLESIAGQSYEICEAKFSSNGDFVAFLFKLKDMYKAPGSAGVALYQPDSGTWITVTLAITSNCDIEHGILFSQDDTKIEIGGTGFEIHGQGAYSRLVEYKPAEAPLLRLQEFRGMGNYWLDVVYNGCYPILYIPFAYEPGSWCFRDGMLVAGCRNTGKVYTLGIDMQAVLSVIT